jgi:hypothetical protein
MMISPALGRVFLSSVKIAGMTSATLRRNWAETPVPIASHSAAGGSHGADSDEGGQLFRLKADSVSDRLRTAFR